MDTFDPSLDENNDSGLEIEQEDSGEIKRPFDPEKIKVRTVNVVVAQIISRINHGEIDLAPDFQRMARIWDDERKSRLIRQKIPFCHSRQKNPLLSFPTFVIGNPELFLPGLFLP